MARRHIARLALAVAFSGLAGAGGRRETAQDAAALAARRIVSTIVSGRTITKALPPTIPNSQLPTQNKRSSHCRRGRGQRFFNTVSG